MSEKIQTSQKHSHRSQSTHCTFAYSAVETIYIKYAVFLNAIVRKLYDVLFPLQWTKKKKNTQITRNKIITIP